jgi:hypothetical protein
MIDTVLRGDGQLDLAAFEATLKDVLHRVVPLDVFAFGTEFVQRDLPDTAGDLDDDCVSGWLTARA